MQLLSVNVCWCAHGCRLPGHGCACAFRMLQYACINSEDPQDQVCMAAVRPACPCCTSYQACCAASGVQTDVDRQDDALDVSNLETVMEDFDQFGWEQFDDGEEEQAQQDGVAGLIEVRAGSPAWLHPCLPACRHAYMACAWLARR